MTKELEFSTYDKYDNIGHYSWRVHKRWMSQPGYGGEPLPEDQASAILKDAVDVGLPPEDAKQAIEEGETAARIECDPGFASTQSISNLKETSRTPLSPLACVARELSVIGMIQDGQIAAVFEKDNGDILPMLQQGLKDIKINP